MAHDNLSRFTRGELHRICQLVTPLAKTCALGDRQVTLHRCFPVQEYAGWHNPEHTHSFFEAHVILDGTAEELTYGARTVGPGAVILHAPGVAHTWHAPASAFLRLTLWFSVTPRISMPVPAAWPCWPELLADWGLLFADVQAQAPGWPDRAAHRMALILSRLLTLTDWPRVPAPSMEHAESLLQAIDRFLEDNLPRPLTRADIAAHLGMSERSLTRHIQHLAGESIMDHLEKLRLTRAMTLLRETDLAIETIGKHVGYPDPAYFTRRFRRYTGTTPSVFRREIP